jgi:hypothetical protein
VFANDVVHIQRRTKEGRYFLRPCPETNALVAFALAVAAVLTGVEIHCVVVLSNHLHIVLTDVHGCHPRFTQIAFRLIALGLKAMYGIDENVWSIGGPEVQRLASEEAVLEALKYAYLNVANAGLDSLDDWPGLALGPDALTGVEQEVDRPACFGRDSQLPMKATLRTSAPRIMLEDSTRSPESLATDLRACVRNEEEAIRDERRQEGRPSVSPTDVVRDDPFFKHPRSPARAGMRLTWKAVTAEAIAEAKRVLRAFRHAYRETMALVRAGVERACFPVGTYQMVVQYGFPCAPS